MIRARCATALLLLTFACVPATAHALAVVGPAPVFVADLSRGIIAIDGSSGAQTIVTNQVFANSITALPAGNLYVTGDKGSSGSRGVYSVDVGAGTASLVTLLSGARAIARINSDTFLVATSDQLYKMNAGGSLQPIGDALPVNERPYIAIGADLLNGTADIWAHAPNVGTGGELYGYSGSGTTLTGPTQEIALSGNGVIGTPNGAGIGYTDAGTRILANARGFGFSADGLVDGVTISSTGFIDPSAVAFESASSMFLLDSEDGLGGSVYRVDLGTGEATPLATSDGTDPTKMRIATGITTTRCFPFACSVSPPAVPPPAPAPAPAPAPPGTTGSAKKATITFAALKKLKLSAKGISVPLTCAIACRMKVSAKLSGLGGRSLALTPVTTSLPAGKSVPVVLKLKKAQRSRVTAALKRHKRVKVAFSAVATATGATTQQLGRTLTLGR